jgi:hypothetical protein
MKKFISLILISVFALCMTGSASASIPANCSSFGYTAYQCVRANNGTWWTAGNNWSGASELHIPACLYVPDLSVPPFLYAPAHYIVGGQLAASDYYHTGYHTWYCGNDASHYTEVWGKKVVY